MTVYKANICRSLLWWGWVSCWAMADVAITQSRADDWPRQPSAGGTPHSPLRTVSDTNGFQHSRWGSFAASVSSFDLITKPHIPSTKAQSLLTIILLLNIFTTTLLLVSVSFMHFPYSYLLLIITPYLSMTDFPFSHLIFPAHSFILVLMNSTVVSKSQNPIRALQRRQLAARDAASNARLTDPTNISWC